MKRLNDKGFTLIEILVTISILSVILSVSIWGGKKLIDKSKEKSYQVTINNVEQAAQSYMKENSDTFTFIVSNNKEYHCITIQDLIDMGYFKNDILKFKYKDMLIKPNDYVYIEKDQYKKLNAKFLFGNDIPQEYKNKCGIADTNQYGRITINVPPGIAKSKLVSFIFDVSNISGINSTKLSYRYKINKNGTYNIIPENNKVEITANCTIYGAIFNGNDIMLEASKLVYGIDNVGPEMLAIKGDTNYTKDKNIQVVFEDKLSGIDKTTKASYAFSQNGNNAPTNYTNMTFDNYKQGDKKIIANIYQKYLTGKYYLWVKYNAVDAVGNVVNKTKRSNSQFYFDNTPPTGEALITTDNNNLIVNASNLKDLHSGIGTYLYSFSESTCPKENKYYKIGNKFEINNGGKYYGCLKLVDKAGNVSHIRSKNSVEINNGFEFTYSNDGYTFTGNPYRDWVLILKKKGNLTIKKINTLVDIFIVSGGEGGGDGTHYGDEKDNPQNPLHHITSGAGGDGGRINTITGVKFEQGSIYSVVIGEGGKGIGGGSANGRHGSLGTDSSISGNLIIENKEQSTLSSAGKEPYASGNGVDGQLPFGDTSCGEIRYGASGGRGSKCLKDKNESWKIVKDSFVDGTPGGADGGGDGGTGYNDMTGGDAKTNSGGGGGGSTGACRGGKGGSGIIIIRNHR